MIILLFKINLIIILIIKLTIRPIKGKVNPYNIYLFIHLLFIYVFI